MANALFDKGRQAFANAGINLSTDTIKVALVTAGYVADLANHQFYSDVTPGSNVLGTPGTLTFTSDTAGVYKASGPTIANVPAGTVTQLIVYKDTGVTTTSPLIARIDTATGLPVTSSGSNFSVAIATDAINGVFKL